MAGSLCRFCGRAACRCGEPYPSKLCPRHGATMQVVSFASRGPGLEGYEVWKWTTAVACSKCDFMRPLKYGQGVPRNENRKTNATRAKDGAVIERLKKKFHAQVRVRIEFTG